ncbi:MAG: MFS transporter [Spirochaetes bacterium]|nr:MFS transporter [Spirochaetota bacterium]
MNQERKITIKNLLSYGVGDIFGGGSFVIINLLFIYFLTDIAKLNPALAGLVVLAGKAWDAISDPIMGYISDTTKSRYGRRRIFFLLGIIPIILSFIAMWLPLSSDSQMIKFLYYASAYVFFSTAFTMVMIPYSALNAEMTREYKERTRLSGARLIFSQISSLISGTVPKMIIDRFQDKGEGFLVMSILFAIFFALPWIIVFFGTWELPDVHIENKSLTDFFKNLTIIWTNKSFRIHIGLYICAYSALDLIMAMFIYYLTYYIQKPQIFTVCLGSMLVTQVLFLPVYVFIANKKGKGFSYRVGVSIWAIALVSTLLFDSNTPMYYIVALSVVMGAGMSAGTMIPWAILPSVTDVGELITGKQQAGVYAGAMTFIRKLVQAIVLAVFGAVLGAIGYKAGMIQSPETLERLRLLFALLPPSLMICGILISLQFKITPVTHPILIQEINRLKMGGSKDTVEPHVKEICEILTGYKYQNLFRKQ